MACRQEASSSNSSNSYLTRGTCKYDIFLSFRGEDTRKGFTDHLYHTLNKSGFRVFRDDKELERGEVISEELLQAINDSHFAIVVLSKNYASSSWCLNELQHILYSGAQVFPIFYDVDPSHVRHQTGKFTEAFAKHQMLQSDNKVIKSWRDSLTKIADLSGWDCKDRNEAELIDTVIEELWTKLHDRLPPYSEDLIGIDNRVQQLEPLLEISLNDVRFVGIWGLPGIGKTTVARAVFEKYRSQFEISCFLQNVRETSERDGELHLQSKLLSHLKIKNMEIEDTYDGKKIIQNCFRDKKVPLILDDVSHTSHLEILANSPNWFGAGSRVIITTRNLDLLRRAHKVHEVKTMNQDESLQLFYSKAFERGELEEDLLEMSRTICDYAKGLPLALSVLGSFFRGRSSVPEWEDALDMLKKNQHNDILRVLKLSFNALTGTEQAIFLDIACFFNGWSKKVITHILESCGFNAKIGIATLQEKSMLKEYDDCLVMHDLLEQMGRRIVVDKSPNDVGNRSRLWSKEDIDEVMENNLGTNEVQGMVSSTFCQACWDSEAFSTLRNLRLLIVTSDFKLPYGLKCLSYALKVLHWTKYPLDTLPPRTRLDKLVSLRMHHSKLKKLWNKSLCSANLKFLDLSYSKNLIETPDFSECPNLERLELEGCEALIDIHASIGQLKKVRVLNLKGCKNLRARCPKKLEISALKEFVLCGCIQVKYLPEFGGSMKNLEMLDVGGTNLVKLPESLGLLSGLVDLRMHHSKLKKLWNKSLCLGNLKFLDLSYSKNLVEIPDFTECTNLERLELEGCEALVDLHTSIGQLKKVQVLNLKGCKNLRARCPKKLEMSALKEFILYGCIQVKYLPEFGESMKNLEMLDAGETNLVKLPESLGLLSGLKTLKLRGCKDLICLPQSIHKLKRLVFVDIAGCSKFGRLPEKLNEMEALEEIDASETDITEVPCSIGGLKKVKKLSFQGCKMSTANSWSLNLLLKRTSFWGHSIHEGLTVPASIWSIKSLKELDLSYCNIDDGSIPFDLGGLSSLKKLNLSGNLFKNLPAGCISNLLKLEFLYLNSCSELGSLPQSGPRLSVVDAGECGSMETMVDEQLFHLFASIDQAEYVREGEVISMTIPGNEIPSWFENQTDLFLNEEGRDSMMIDMPPCGEEMLGIGLCVVLDNDKFYSTGPNKRPLALPCWWYDFAREPFQHDIESVFVGRERLNNEEIKSSHLWIVLWKQREELSHILQLSKHSQIPLRFDVKGEKVDAIKCGWRVIRKADFGNCTSSTSQQHKDQENTISSEVEEQGQGSLLKRETSQSLIKECEISSICSEDEVKLDDSWMQFIADDARFWF